ncbi:MAG: GrpB family protein [Candidatus Paceibacterota bacterium]
MKHTEIVEFLSSKKLQEEVKGIFEKEKWIIENNVTVTDIQNVGSTAIPGAIGKYDVDLQIRVSQEQFDEVIFFMKGYAEAKNPAYWTDQFALFKDAKDIIDYNVTVIGSRHDVFHHTRDYLIQYPNVLHEYVQLKLRYQGKTYGEYRDARHSFFQSIKPLIRQLHNLPE